MASGNDLADGKEEGASGRWDTEWRRLNKAADCGLGGAVHGGKPKRMRATLVCLRPGACKEALQVVAPHADDVVYIYTILRLINKMIADDLSAYWQGFEHEEVAQVIAEDMGVD